MRRLKFLILTAFFTAGVQLSAQTTESAFDSSPPEPTLQELFDQASAAEQAGNCDLALPLFERLATHSGVKQGSIPAGAIAVRRGNCLIAKGRYEEGRKFELEGLPILKGAGSDFDLDVAAGELSLGRAARHDWQHDSAVGHFRTALSKFTGKDRLPTLVDLAMITSFDGGTEPLGYVDEAIRIVEAEEKPDKKVLGSLHTLRGRILMNQGMNEEAYEELKTALKLSGGLTTRVNLSQVAIRGDLAQAALLVGRPDDARKYLAYTGMGHVEEFTNLRATNMSPPPCGTQTGLKPDDVAIVEFGIGKNGDVTGAQTIYSRGNYEVAAAFARAVSEWYWDPETVSEVPLFFRTLARVELRCSATGESLPGVATPLRNRFAEWAGAQLPQVDEGRGTYGFVLEKLQEVALSSERSGNIPAAVAALGMRGAISPISSEAMLAELDHARKLGLEAKLPDEVLNGLAVFRALAAKAIEHENHHNRAGHRDPIDAGVLNISNNSPLAQDALAQNTLLLLAVPPLPDKSDLSLAREILLRVAGDARLPEHHPLRQLAWLRLANFAAQDDEYARADEYFRNTGLNEQQCALIGPTPAMKRTGVSGSDYPDEAGRMGFEGWVQLEFDITADGKAVNARPVVAFPPFVFVEAATAIADGVRYDVSYRPSGGTACSAHTEMVRFDFR